MNWNRICARFLVFLPLAGLLALKARPQQMSSFDRDRALSMLDNVARDVQSTTTIRVFTAWTGMRRFSRRNGRSKQRLRSTSLNLALAHIAAALTSLNDSHTFFLPPTRGRWRRDRPDRGNPSRDGVETDSTRGRNTEPLGDRGSVGLGGTGGLEGTEVDSPRTGGERRQGVWAEG